MHTENEEIVKRGYFRLDSFFVYVSSRIFVYLPLGLLYAGIISKVN